MTDDRAGLGERCVEGTSGSGEGQVGAHGVPRRPREHRPPPPAALGRADRPDPVREPDPVGREDPGAAGAAGAVG